MTEKQNEIKDEFEAFANNLRDAMQSAWESDERKKAQSEIEGGLREIGDVLEKFIGDVRESETGQRVKDGVEDLGERIRSGEITEQAREGLLSALRKINSKFQDVMDPMPQEETEE